MKIKNSVLLKMLLRKWNDKAQNKRKYFQSTYMIKDLNPENINKSQHSVRKLTTQLRLGTIFEKALH